MKSDNVFLWLMFFAWLLTVLLVMAPLLELIHKSGDSIVHRTVTVALLFWAKSAMNGMLCGVWVFHWLVIALIYLIAFITSVRANGYKIIFPIFYMAASLLLPALVFLCGPVIGEISQVQDNSVGAEKWFAAILGIGLFVAHIAAIPLLLPGFLFALIERCIRRRTPGTVRIDK